MKNLVVHTLFLVLFSNAIHGQEVKPQILKEPANWEFERFPLPPAFAPAITYKGAEELRFAPGMFKKEAADYFSYIFVAQLDTARSISGGDIKNYLLHYYKGLCSAVANDRKLKVDTGQISVLVKKKKAVAPDKVSYNGTVNLFGVFADGAPVTLYMEIDSLSNTATNKTWIFFLASPRDKKDPIWKEFREIRRKTLISVNG
jgi:hypothetical protein